MRVTENSSIIKTTFEVDKLYLLSYMRQPCHADPNVLEFLQGASQQSHFWASGYRRMHVGAKPVEMSSTKTCDNLIVFSIGTPITELLQATAKVLFVNSPKLTSATADSGSFTNATILVVRT